MSQKVKITIIEPSAIVRTGLVTLLKGLHNLHPDIYEVDDPTQVRSALGWQQPQLIVVNPAILGALSLAHIRRESPQTDTRIIALQTGLLDGAVLKCYDEVISLNDSADAVREKITRLVSEPDAGRHQDSLSLREKEVVACVVQGMTNKQIADKLCLSAHTVITHRRNISSKLGIHSTAGLTIYAIVNKLVDLDDARNIPGGDAA